jgi:poly(A) polymerase
VSFSTKALLNIDISRLKSISESNALLSVVKLLKSPRLVGGCVRDSIIGITPKDIDIATSLEPEEVMSSLKTGGVHSIPTGLKYGTVTAICEDEKFEITTLRKDISCDGRYAKVEFCDDYFDR